MEDLTLAADLENLKRIREFVKEAAQAGGLDERAAYKLQLAVDEIATNVIMYGYANTLPGAQITLRAELLSDTVRITMEDQGAPFDPSSRVSDETNQIDEPLEDRAIGGLGIFLALNGVDQFSYKRIDDTNFNIFEIRRSGSGNRP